MAFDAFNVTATANQDTFLGILQGANNATNQIFMSVFILVLYFILFVVFKERMPDVKNSLLVVTTIMLFLVTFLFWIEFIPQIVLTLSIILFGGSLMAAIWRGDN